MNKWQEKMNKRAVISTYKLSTSLVVAVVYNIITKITMNLDRMFYATKVLCHRLIIKFCNMHQPASLWL